MSVNSKPNNPPKPSQYARKRIFLEKMRAIFAAAKQKDMTVNLSKLTLWAIEQEVGEYELSRMLKLLVSNDEIKIDGNEVIVV